MSFHSQKVGYFCFYTVHMDNCGNIYFGIIFTSRNIIYFFFKKLEVVMIARYLNTFWIFAFSLFEILHEHNYGSKINVTLAVSQ